MTTEEIGEIAIDSAKAYFNYLEKNDKGIQTIDVFELEYLQSKDTIIKLRLSAKIFDTEAIFFKLLSSNKKYDISNIKVIEYDADRNILIVKPIETLSSDFSNLKNTNIKVISDLKFLVERVKTWYELNSGRISLPTKVSKYSKDFKNIEFFKDSNFQPSENQKQSLENIFTNPFSYVWGAPGTGKTQFVLSYAVLHYIKRDDTIAILAPTNNAIEQVLKGLIKMTDKAGINRSKILRLGTPSKKFAEAFPEVCEEKGIQKRIDEIDKQIDILERMFSFQVQKQAIISFEDSKHEFKKISNSSSEVKTQNDLILKLNNSLKTKDAEIKIIIDKKLEQKQQLNKLVIKVNSFPHKIIKFFSSKRSDSECAIEKIEKDIIENNRYFEQIKHMRNEINNILISHKNTVKIIQDRALSEINNLKNKSKFLSDINKIISNLSIENVLKIQNEVNFMIAQKLEKLDKDQHLYNEYKTLGLSDIESSLNSYYNLRDKLASSSTTERLKSVNVIACTLDGYIGRYTEETLNVEHIFLDEAGYANIIKALTLFKHKVPVSFLGDHKQLPPVCEINDINIEKDNNFSNMFLWAQSAIFLDTLFSNSKHVCRNQYLKNSSFNPINISKTSLNSTYRFGDNLAEILSKYVYENDFKSSNPDGQTAILYVDAKKTDALKSRVSMNEVFEIVKIVENLKQSGENDFVILTPYKHQIKFLNNHLPQERNDLKILTVHGSQGREWDTVILSIVDTSDMWFVDTTIPISKGLNLVNTAVSRAKKNLIIVCDKNYWMNQENQLVTELIHCGQEMIN